MLRLHKSFNVMCLNTTNLLYSIHNETESGVGDEDGVKFDDKKDDTTFFQPDPI